MNLRLDVRILCIPKLWCSCSARICNKNSCTIFFWKYMYYSLLITDQCRARRWEQIKTLLGRIQDTLGPIGKCTIRNRLQDNATKTAPRQILSTNSIGFVLPGYPYEDKWTSLKLPNVDPLKEERECFPLKIYIFLS